MTATPAWPPKSAPRLFVETELSDGAEVVVRGQQAHYLISVMRIKPGEPVKLFDDKAGEWLAEATVIGKRDLILKVDGKLREREEVPDLWLCAALIKKPRFDLIIEKATELGVRRIVPVITRRSVADKLNPERARSIAIEAAEQCNRTALPEIAAVTRFDNFLNGFQRNRTLFFADEEGGIPMLDAVRDHPGPAAILIGPEGGFDDEERSLVRALPQSAAITLGPRVLRAETAAIAAISLWMACSKPIKS